MPTYEYRCGECGQHVEVVQSFSDDPLTVCGACGGPLKKVFGSVGIVFKGSGFYKTDSRGSSKTAAKAGASGDSSGGGTGGGSSSDGGGSGGGSSESKPASSSSTPSSGGGEAKSA